MTIQTEKGVGPMKMKNIVAMTMAATMVWNGTAVFGATGVKTAVLNDARISFNGGTPQTIQCYMICLLYTSWCCYLQIYSRFLRGSAIFLPDNRHAPEAQGDTFYRTSKWVREYQCKGYRCLIPVLPVLHRIPAVSYTHLDAFLM